MECAAANAHRSRQGGSQGNYMMNPSDILSGIIRVVFDIRYPLLEVNGVVCISTCTIFEEFFDSYSSQTKSSFPAYCTNRRIEV